MARELKKRSEIPEEFTWKLSDMYESVQDWEKELEEACQLTDQLAAFEGKIGASAENLLQVQILDETIDRKLGMVFNYAERLFDQDTRNNANQAYVQKACALATECGSKTAFLIPEILQIEGEVLEKYYAQEPALELYRKKIEEIQRLKPHTLSAEMEKLLAMTGNMARSAENIYSLLKDSDFVYPSILDEKGEEIRLTNGNFVPLEESPDRRVRKDAFEKYYSVFRQFNNSLAATLDAQVEQLMFQARARGYASTLEAAVDANNVSPKVYRNLIDVIDQNLDKMHRYVSLRKKLLGVDELHMYDVYTPIVADADRKISFEEAKETVLKALAPLGEDYVAKVKEGFENRWIDVYENEGKRGGAYSAGQYGVHPYVLLNFSGTLDSMFTLAHEMGHAMHSYYSNTNQPFIYSRYRIFVAEVASTCNEVLLMEYLLAHTEDKKQRAYLLNHYMESFKSTVYRQAMFAEFEMLMHRKKEAGESLTAEVLNALYLELNRKYFGPDMISDPEIALEWSRIPHFYYNFYVYQYSTGYSAAVSIAHGILREGAPAVERYKKFLSGGCSDKPVELLKLAGVDMEQKQAIQSALDVFEEVIKEMEELTEVSAIL